MIVQVVHISGTIQPFVSTPVARVVRSPSLSRVTSSGEEVYVGCRYRVWRTRTLRRPSRRRRTSDLWLRGSRPHPPIWVWVGAGKPDPRGGVGTRGRDTGVSFGTRRDGPGSGRLVFWVTLSVVSRSRGPTTVGSTRSGRPTEECPSVHVCLGSGCYSRPEKKTPDLVN